MNAGLRNTIVGVVLTVALGAILGGVGVILSDTKGNTLHLAKIDELLARYIDEQRDTKDTLKVNQGILWELKSMQNIVPAVVETRLQELRDRLNSHEERLNYIDRKGVVNVTK